MKTMESDTRKLAKSNAAMEAMMDEMMKKMYQLPCSPPKPRVKAPGKVRTEEGTENGGDPAANGVDPTASGVDPAASGGGVVVPTDSVLTVIPYVICFRFFIFIFPALI